MRFQRAIFGVVFGALFGFMSGMGTVTAQSLSKSAGPNELPPSNFKGRQYVDTKGCVYVRAGFDGNVTWVPRVGKSRKLICGFKPTFSGSQVATAPRPVAIPKVKVATAPAPKPALRVQRPQAAKPLETIASAPRVVVQAPKPVAVPVQPQAQVTCRQTGGFFGGGKRGQDCRPGKVRVVFPGGVQPVTVRPAPTAPARVANTVRTVRTTQPGTGVTQVAIPAPPPVPLAIPKGYKRAWNDDRLNPNRGRGTAVGAAQMARVWTNELPRQLVTETKVTRTKAVRKTARTSSKAPQPKVADAASHRFVQVGVYGQPQNARNSIAVLRNLSLPVRTGSFQRKGKNLQIVLAGPFRSQAELTRALSAARRAGFRDAVLRK